MVTSKRNSTRRPKIVLRTRHRSALAASLLTLQVLLWITPHPCPVTSIWPKAIPVTAVVIPALCFLARHLMCSRLHQAKPPISAWRTNALTRSIRQPVMPSVLLFSVRVVQLTNSQRHQMTYLVCALRQTSGHRWRP